MGADDDIEGMLAKKDQKREKKVYFTKYVIYFWTGFFLLFIFPLLFLLPAYSGLPLMISLPPLDDDGKLPDGLDYNTDYACESENASAAVLDNLEAVLLDGSTLKEYLVPVYVWNISNMTGVNESLLINPPPYVVEVNNSNGTMENVTIYPTSPVPRYDLPGPCKIGLPRPSFCKDNANQQQFFCVDPYTAAILLFIFGAYPPAVYLILVTNLEFFRRAYRILSHDTERLLRDYIHEKQVITLQLWGKPEQKRKFIKRKQDLDAFHEKARRANEIRRYCICGKPSLLWCTKLPLCGPRICMRIPLCRPRAGRAAKWVCLKRDLAFRISFVVCVFFPMSVLLPVYLSVPRPSIDNATGLSTGGFATTIDNETGKQIFMLSLAGISGLYWLIVNARLLMYCMNRHQRRLQRQLDEEEEALQASLGIESRRVGENADRANDAAKYEGSRTCFGRLTYCLYRCCFRCCNKSRLGWIGVSFVVGVLPLVLAFMLTNAEGLPPDLFASSLDEKAASEICLAFVVGPIYVWILFVIFAWSMRYPREAPRGFRSRRQLRIGRQRQREFDLELARRKRLDPWRVYEYPEWSIGHGLVTTGERRVLPLLDTNTEVIPRRLAIVTFFMLVFPIFVILPIAIELEENFKTFERYPNSTKSAFLAFMGFPAAWCAVYGGRLVWGVISRHWKLVFRHFCLWLFVNFVVPLGILLPIYESTKDSFTPLTSAWAAFVVHTLPIISGVLLGLVVLRHVPDLWDWASSLRVELHWRYQAATAVIEVSNWLTGVPFFLFVYGAVLLTYWEDKAVASVEIFVIFTAVLGVLYLIFGFWALVAAYWLDVVDYELDVESFSPLFSTILMAFLSVYCLGQMDMWVTQFAPYIRRRMTEDDPALYRLTHWVTIGMLCCTLMGGRIRAKVMDKIKNRNNFGYHPADWELYSPTLLDDQRYQDAQRLLHMPAHLSKGAKMMQGHLDDDEDPDDYKPGSGIPEETEVKKRKLPGEEEDDLPTDENGNVIEKPPDPPLVEIPPDDAADEIWYGKLKRRLGRGFTFGQNAEDFDSDNSDEEDDEEEAARRRADERKQALSDGGGNSVGALAGAGVI